MAFKLKGAFANLEYGYAITSHKAQGSTYTNVYVMEDNILGQTNASDIKAKNQSLYVAVSRPTNKLVMISSENVNKSENITFAKSESPNFESENINLELSEKEQELLIKKHGKNAVEDYNELTNEEKEYIIKCL